MNFSFADSGLAFNLNNLLNNYSYIDELPPAECDSVRQGGCYSYIRRFEPFSVIANDDYKIADINDFIIEDLGGRFVQINLKYGNLYCLLIVNYGWILGNNEPELCENCGSVDLAEFSYLCFFINSENGIVNKNQTYTVLPVLVFTKVSDNYIDGHYTPAVLKTTIADTPYITGKSVFNDFDTPILSENHFLEKSNSYKFSGGGLWIDEEQNNEINRRIIEKYKGGYHFRKENGFNTGDFDFWLYIDGELIDICRFVNTLTLTRAENQTTILELALMEDCGEFDYYQFHNKKIELYCLSEKHGFTRLFLGDCNYCSISPFLPIVTLNCSDAKRNKISNLPIETIKQIGFFSKKLFNTDNQEEEFNKRMESIQSSYFFDENGEFQLTAWKPDNNHIDFVIDDNEIFNEINIKGLQCDNVVNRVNVNFDFIYPRKFIRTINCSYRSNASDRDIVCAAFPFCPTTAQVEQTAGGAGWHLDLFRQTAGMPNDGWYNCGTAFNPLYTKWSNREVSTQTETQPDGSISTVTYLGKDEQFDWCRAAYWTVSKRWKQEIGEKYTISVENAESQDFFNLHSEEINYNVKYELPEEDDFLDDGKINAADFTAINENNSYCNEINDDNLSEFEEAVLYALNVAKTKIYQSHLSECGIKTGFNPLFSLNNTVGVQSKYVQGAMKIKMIKHSVDFVKMTAYSEIGTHFYKGFSGSLNTVEMLQRAEPEPENIETPALNFGNVFIGIDAETPDTDGYIIKQMHDIPDPHYKWQGVQLKITMPDIEKENTDALNVEIKQTQDIVIPDDNVMLKFVCS